MRCLGIESSCDDTALALVDDGRLVASVAASQADMHALFGGVVPELASREHARLIGPLFDSLLAQAGAGAASIDCVAFARGPGLLGSLLVGASFAKALAWGLGRPLIGINHLHAHLLAPGLEGPLEFPALGLLVSGGHTHIYRMHSPREFQLLGRTLDDAAGEAFDKVGKVLGLPYPAGKIIDDLAQKGRVHKNLFRCPYLNNDNLDFSFSGLKTAAGLLIAEHPSLRASVDAAGLFSLEAKAKHQAEQQPVPSGDLSLEDFCASFAAIIAETLRVKLERALVRERDERGEQGIRALVLAGGVAANSSVRSAIHTLATAYGLPLRMPSFALCTDNGGMVAHAGYLLAQAGFSHDLSVSCVPRGTPVPDDMILHRERAHP